MGLDGNGPRRRVALVAVDMGLGHLRAAHALAPARATPVLEIDRPPLASPAEQRRWGQVRAFYETLSRSSQLPVVGRPMRRLLEGITFIPQLYGARDQSRATLGTRMLEALARRGFGRGALDYLHREDATLVTTFYAPAVIADFLGYHRTVCVVTDSDINRVWVSRWPAHSTVHYCVPSERALRRLRAFGVRPEFTHLTGFPLPPELMGGPDLAVLRANLAARLVRLDRRGVFREQLREEIAHLLGALPTAEEGRPPLLTFAVGGAGAQLGIARSFLPSLRRPLEQRQLRLALVAGAILAFNPISIFYTRAVLPEPLMLLYHCNFGYPLVSADSRIYTSGGSVDPRAGTPIEAVAQHDRLGDCLHLLHDSRGRRRRAAPGNRWQNVSQFFFQ